MTQEENFVGKVIYYFTLIGHNVENIIKRSNTLIDLIIISNEGEKWITRYQNTDLDENSLRDFFKLLQNENAKQATLITKGEITNKARELAKNKPIYILDEQQFISYINKVNSKKISRTSSHKIYRQKATKRLITKSYQSKNKINSKIFIFLILILILPVFCICTSSIIYQLNTILTNSNSIEPIRTPSKSDENIALKTVQNWKPPDNVGLTCKESVDSIIEVYKYDLGIYDAESRWEVKKQSEQTYIINAYIKGETGWAKFSWLVNLQNGDISAMNNDSICQP